MTPYLTQKLFGIVWGNKVIMYNKSEKNGRRLFLTDFLTFCENDSFIIQYYNANFSLSK
jgi:hypothetical protein